MEFRLLPDVPVNGSDGVCNGGLHLGRVVRRLQAAQLSKELSRTGKIGKNGIGKFNIRKIVLQLALYKRQAALHFFLFSASVYHSLSGEGDYNTKAYSHEIHKVAEPVPVVPVRFFHNCYKVLSRGLTSSTSLPDLIMDMTPEKWQQKSNFPVMLDSTKVSFITKIGKSGNHIRRKGQGK